MGERLAADGLCGAEECKRHKELEVFYDSKVVWRQVPGKRRRRKVVAADADADADANADADADADDDDDDDDNDNDDDDDSDAEADADAVADSNGNGDGNGNGNGNGNDGSSSEDDDDDDGEPYAPNYLHWSSSDPKHNPWALMDAFTTFTEERRGGKAVGKVLVAPWFLAEDPGTEKGQAKLRELKRKRDEKDAK